MTFFGLWPLKCFGQVARDNQSAKHKELSSKQRPKTQVQKPISESNILKLKRLALNPCCRWCDPVRDLSGLDHRMHQATDILSILHRRQPIRLALIEVLFRNQIALDVEILTGIFADVAMETDIRQVKSLAKALFR